MRTRSLGGVAAGVIGLGAATVFGQGADVITGELTGPFEGGGVGPRKWGSIGNVTSYSIGTTSCNEGNVPLNWFSPGADHPLITNNMYRLKDGRFEQIGISWIKHGFCALQGTVCGSCTPTGGGCEDTLGVGCSDPYGSSLNGSQSGIGPRSDVNGATGVFTWPYSTQGQTGDVLYKRIQVDNDDLDPSMNSGALYWCDGHYLAADDAAANNDDNNASIRRFTVSTFSGGGYFLNFAGSTEREKFALLAWQENGLGAGVPDPDVTLTSVDVPSDGRFWVGCKVSDNGDGTWDYEYAIQNMSSDRCGGSFSVPLGAGTTASSVGFHDIDYHSGEPYDPTDWSSSTSGSAVTWTSPNDHATDPDSNALRWGTIYNYRFTADAAPVSGTATLGLFKPGTPTNMSVSVQVPGAAGVTTSNLMSFKQTTDIPGEPKAFANDIVSYDASTNDWETIFDGSDVNLGAKISGFSIIDGAGGPEIVMSFFGPVTISGLVGGPGGSEDVEKHDMVRFEPVTLGDNTSGTFHFYFDGSDVGLFANAHNIDAVDVDASGDIHISQLQGKAIQGMQMADEDVATFSPTSLGDVTSGTWAKLFDGSDVDLTVSSEDIDAFAFDPHSDDLFMSTVGPANMTGASGDDEDIFRFDPITLGTSTTGTWSLEHDLSAIGIDPVENIGAMDVLDYDILGALRVPADRHPTFQVVTPQCPGDYNNDDVGNTQDVVDFLNAYNAGDRDADWDWDGVLTSADVLAFMADFTKPCR